MAKRLTHQLAYRAIRIEGGLIPAEEVPPFYVIEDVVAPSTPSDPLWGGIELGGSYGWNGNTRSLSASVDLATSLKDFGDSFSARGNLGFRLLW